MLFKVLKSLGYYNAYAGISLPNPASVAFHEKMGFWKIGVFEDTGYKLDDLARCRMVATGIAG